MTNSVNQQKEVVRNGPGFVFGLNGHKFAGGRSSKTALQNANL